jgi:hypothetical protein
MEEWNGYTIPALSEEGGNILLRNDGNYLQDYMQL